MSLVPFPCSRAQVFIAPSSCFRFPTHADADTAPALRYNGPGKMKAARIAIAAAIKRRTRKVSPASRRVLTHLEVLTGNYFGALGRFLKLEPGNLLLKAQRVGAGVTSLMSGLIFLLTNTRKMLKLSRLIFLA